MGILTGNFTGKTRLWIVFWIHNMFIGTIVNRLTEEFASQTPAVFYAWLSFVILWCIWVCVGLWQCAFNAKYRFWGYILRPFVVLCSIYLLYSFYTAFSM
ncbi:hypothetical protein N483_09250 [Pseudoalteromonas luteoviolacea NCIMB 1944]|uniref:Uncharacterized protein n=1 Tax=Pseudoalteromonas luteoviolacea (strain 2ta16) TaxID=1353533 RepID=V4HXX7_PSEL2|nr:hypothetical protein PL2TA16_00663 [Pseudoalteromonas luteoviolacea 2ta16]KZN43472.1 hypothetical protein N483_09250 [Pseudoalteromonas luteoviolacea NCIMB 1944]